MHRTILKIQTGRQNKLNIEERVCDMCGDGYVEDEYHFVLIRRVFKELRLQYIPVQTGHSHVSQNSIALWALPTLLISLVFMFITISLVLMFIGHYVYNAMKIRESFEFKWIKLCSIDFTIVYSLHIMPSYTILLLQCKGSRAYTCMYNKMLKLKLYMNFNYILGIIFHICPSFLSQFKNAYLLYLPLPTR